MTTSLDAHPGFARALARCLRATCWLACWIGLLASAPTRGAAQLAAGSGDTDVDHVFVLMARRLALMPEVAAAKWHEHLPVADPEREQVVLEQTAQRARDLGITPDSARALIELQVGFARAIQTRYFEHWSRSGIEPEGARDLKKLLRPELDRLGLDLLRALALALPELTRADASERLALRTRALLLEHGLAPDQAPTLAGALSALRALPEARLTRIRATGVLRVGTTGDYAPFSSDAGDGFAGLDIELVQAFAKTLGVSVRFVRTSWPGLLADYARDAFDIAASGISITPERAQLARFSLAYHSGGKTPIARCDARTRFGTLAEIDAAGVRVIVNPGGTNEQFVRSTLHAAELVLFADNRTIFEELVARRADVMITDDIEAQLQQRRHPELCRTMRALLTQAEKAWLVQSDTALLERVNAWLGARVRSGAVARSLTRQLRAAQ